MSSSRDQAPSGIEIVDLFAGPGGLDVGAHWLGLATTGIEWNDGACATRQEAGLATIQGDVRDHSPLEFPEATVLAGGPPCQTYTVAGGGSGRRALDDVVALVRRMADGANVAKALTTLEDERTGLVLEPLRWALQAIDNGRPFESIVLEQVPAVLPIWQAVGDVLIEHGYGVTTGILRTEEYGVPQTRRRAILLAGLGWTPKLPTPTHEPFRKGGVPQASLDRLPYVSLGETLGLSGRFTVRSNYGSGGDPKNRGRRAHDEPAATVTGKVTRNRIESRDGSWRHMTISEAGRLQTFPPDYPWNGTDIGQQIGNAIPPRLAAHVLAAACGIEISTGDLDDLVQSPWRSNAPDSQRLEASA